MVHGQLCCATFETATATQLDMVGDVVGTDTAQNQGNMSRSVYAHH